MCKYTVTYSVKNVVMLIFDCDQHMLRRLTNDCLIIQAS